jgi:histone acetyltransferase (RNA polymerase elongator complex component)
MAAEIVPFFISHRGCPHRCVFCNQEKISGSGGRLPSEAEIRDAISSRLEANGMRPVEVAFYGGTFTSLSKEEQRGLLDPLQPLIGSGGVSSVRVSTRPDAINGEISAFLAEMGVGTVELGCQSMDDEVLAQAGRGHTAMHTIEASMAVKKAGLSLGIQLMPGLPGDTMEKSLASLERALALNPDFLRIYPAVVIEGTGLADLYREGRYQPMALEEAVQLCKVMLHRALEAGVRVVRMGLQASPELDSPGTVLTGPYHPAFRQLVEAELCYDLLVQLIRGLPEADLVSINCAPSRISDVVGHRRGNLQRLSEEHGVEVVAVRGDGSLGPQEVMVVHGEIRRRGNIIKDLDYGGNAS